MTFPYLQFYSVYCPVKPIAKITVHNSINAIGSTFISRRTGVLNFPKMYPNANPTEFNFQAIKIKNESPIVRTLLGIVVLDNNDIRTMGLFIKA